jgi:hypothetical protein
MLAELGVVINIIKPEYIKSILGAVTVNLTNAEDKDLIWLLGGAWEEHHVLICLPCESNASTQTPLRWQQHPDCRETTSKSP